MTSGALRRSLADDFEVGAEIPGGTTPHEVEQTQKTVAVEPPGVVDPSVEPKASCTTPASRTQAVLQANKDRRDNSADVLRQALLALGPPGKLSPEDLAKELASLHAQVHDMGDQKMTTRVPEKEPAHEIIAPKAMPAEKEPKIVGGPLLERGKSSVALQVAAPTSGLPTVRYEVPNVGTGPLPALKVVVAPAPHEATAPGPTGEVAAAAAAPTPTMEIPATVEHAEAHVPPTEPGPAHADGESPQANAPTTMALQPTAPPPDDVDAQQLLEELRTGWVDM